MVDTLERARDKRGLPYRNHYHGQPGGVTVCDFLLAYRKGKPCPACGTTVAKIKTGSTASYVRRTCQPMPS
ncbi:MAG: hypothetical protein HPY83_06920 [Anaerolineae bacterium]|nr:hypothetical protein [Anaerolineae bacterium]